MSSDATLNPRPPSRSRSEHSAAGSFEIRPKEDPIPWELREPSNRGSKKRVRLSTDVRYQRVPLPELLQAPANDTLRPMGEHTQLSPIYPGALVGRYLLLEELADGDAGTVYAAFDPNLNRRIALKFLSCGNQESARTEQRALAQAQRMARVSHPNVMPIFDVGVSHGRIYLAMELLEGQTMRGWLRENGGDVSQVFSIMRDVAQGLCAIHDQGLTHRDIRPENIFVRDDGHVWILNLGLEHSAEEHDPPHEPALVVSDTIASIGNALSFDQQQSTRPYYIAPNVDFVDTIGPKDDQFSFCVTFFEALYGHRPFLGRTRREIRDAMFDRQVYPPATRKRLPRAVVEALWKGLEPEPNSRFYSMRELLSVLDPPRRFSSLPAYGLSFIAAIVPILGIAFAASNTHPEQLACLDASQSIHAKWDTHESAIARRFEAVAPRHGIQSFQRLRSLIYQYSEDWSHEYTHTCRSEHADAASDPQFDAKMACLQNASNQLEDTLNRFTTASASRVNESVEIAHELLDPSICSDPNSIQLRYPITDPEIAQRLSAAQSELSEISALSKEGRIDEAAKRIEILKTRTSDIEHPPWKLELQRVLAHLAVQQGDVPRAIELLETIFNLSISIHDSATAAYVSLQLVYFRVYLNSEPERESELIARTRAHLVAAGSTQFLLQHFHNVLGIMSAIRGDNPRSLDHFRIAYRLAAQNVEKDPLEFAAVATNLAVVFGRRGDFDTSLNLAERSRQIYLHELGDRHPNLINVQRNSAYLFRDAGKFDLAIDAANTARDLCVAHARTSTSECRFVRAVQAQIRIERGEVAALEDFAKWVQKESAAGPMPSPDDPDATDFHRVLIQAYLAMDDVANAQYWSSDMQKNRKRQLPIGDALSPPLDWMFAAHEAIQNVNKVAATQLLESQGFAATIRPPRSIPELLVLLQLSQLAVVAGDEEYQFQLQQKAWQPWLDTTPPQVPKRNVYQALSLYQDAVGTTGQSPQSSDQLARLKAELGSDNFWYLVAKTASPSTKTKRPPA